MHGSDWQGSLLGIAQSIDRLQRGFGRALAWLVLGVALAQFSVVILRHVFDTGFVWQQVNIRHMNGVFCMAGLGYAFLHNAHVRMDLFHRSASERTRAWIDLAGVVFFLLPVCVALVWASRDYVINAWRVFEGASEGGGVPLIFLYKSMLWAGAALLFAQGVSVAVKSVLFLCGCVVDRYAPER